MDSKTQLEEWRAVSNTNGKYEVSNCGRVRTNNRRPGLLTLTKQASGYRYAMVQLENGKQKNCRVNRLVAMAFVSNPNGLPEVNHIDGNKENNHASNLEWVTRSQNVKHSFDTGIRQPHKWTEEEKQLIASKVSATMKQKACQGRPLNLKKC